VGDAVDAAVAAGSDCCAVTVAAGVDAPMLPQTESAKAEPNIVDKSVSQRAMCVVVNTRVTPCLLAL
jgi:hypothetical protein